MASERDAPAAGGTGGAATEAEVDAVRDILADDMTMGMLGNRDIAELIIEALDEVRAAARAPSPAEAEVRALREERDSLRAALIATGRAVGAYLHEDVSISFLALIPNEARLVMQRHARAREENERLRALLAASPAPCPYCSLAADRMAECAHGFPGCARADDLGTDDLPPMPEPDPERAAADDPVPEFDGSPATPTSVGDGHGRG